MITKVKINVLYVELLKTDVNICKKESFFDLMELIITVGT